MFQLLVQFVYFILDLTEEEAKKINARNIDNMDYFENFY